MMNFTTRLSGPTVDRRADRRTLLQSATVTVAATVAAPVSGLLGPSRALAKSHANGPRERDGRGDACDLPGALELSSARPRNLDEARTWGLSWRG